MQPRSVVFLDEIGEFLIPSLDGAGRRLGRLSEITLASVFFEPDMIRVLYRQ